MAITARSVDRMLSLPRKVIAGAWTSDTISLQREGWKFYCEYEPYYAAYNIAAVYKDMEGQMLSLGNRIDDYHMQYMERDSSPLIFGRMGSKIVMQGDKWRGRRFHPIDMRPSLYSSIHEEAIPDHVPLDILLYVPVKSHDFYDQKPDIIVKDHTVDEMLAMIKAKFAASDEEYYESKDAGLITDQQEVQRHLHLVSVRK